MTARSRIASVQLCAAVLMLVAVGCGKKAEVAGHWVGPVDFGPANGVTNRPQDTTFHVVMDIRSEDGKLSATMSREDEPQAVPADKVELNGSDLTISQRKQVFSLKLTEDGKELRGSLKIPPYTFALNLTKAAG